MLQVATLGRAARNAASVKNRQPLRAVYVKSDTPLGELFQKIVLDELNIKAYTQVTDTSRFTAYTFKPQLKIVGQKYGKQVGAIRQALAELDGGAAYAELQQTGGVTLQLPDGPVTLSEEELLIDASSAAGYAVQEDPRRHRSARHYAGRRADRRGVCPRTCEQTADYAQGRGL